MYNDIPTIHEVKQWIEAKRQADERKKQEVLNGLKNFHTKRLKDLINSNLYDYNEKEHTYTFQYEITDIIKYHTQLPETAQNEIAVKITDEFIKLFIAGLKMMGIDATYIKEPAKWNMTVIYHDTDWDAF